MKEKERLALNDALLTLTQWVLEEFNSKKRNKNDGLRLSNAIILLESHFEDLK